MRSISLFSGAGGLDLGCEAAGFVTAAAVEHNETAVATLLANRDTYFPLLERGRDPPGHRRDVDPKSCSIAPGSSRGRGDLVHGGPPCTPFSKSGYWLAYKRAGEDPKASLLDNFVDVVRAAQPKAFLMENVFALGYRNQNRAVFERFIAGISAAGYSFDHSVLVAADYGVPQNRQRLICVGVATGSSRRARGDSGAFHGRCDPLRAARDAQRLGRVPAAPQVRRVRPSTGLDDDDEPARA